MTTVHFLNTLPFDFGRPESRELRDLLEQTIPRTDDVIRLLQSAGVLLGHIHLGQSPQALWSDALSTARNQNRLRPLLEGIGKNPFYAALAPRLSEFLQDQPVLEAPPIRAVGQPFAWNDAAERIIGPRSTLLSTSFLTHGAHCAKAVVRLLVMFGTTTFYGSGFFIAPDLVLTNHHVLFHEAYGRAERVEIWLDYEDTLHGNMQCHTTAAGNVSTIVGRAELDWAVIRTTKPALDLQYVLSLGSSLPVREGDRVNIIQHPYGGPKRIGLVHNEVRHVGDTYIQYLTDTDHGSSGSPVFNERWDVVALHYRWREVLANGKAELRNEGMRIDRIAAEIMQSNLLEAKRSMVSVPAIASIAPAHERIEPVRVGGRARPRLDSRLATLLEIGFSFFTDGAGEDTSSGQYTNERGRAPLRRSGPLAFSRGESNALSSNERASTFSLQVFITTKSPESLSRLGIALRSVAGNMATAHLTLNEIELLERDEAVVSIEWSGGASVPAAIVEREPASRASVSSLPAPTWDGTGVVIGIVDVEGMDLYHPDFIDVSKNPRILYLWDQTSSHIPNEPGRVPTPWCYGVEYTREDIYQELDPGRKRPYSFVKHECWRSSHATMVAGIAAGSGKENPQARGVAPGARLIYVNTCSARDGSLASTTELAEAIEYVFRRAGNTPCVVNVSLADELGPHDGTSPVERFVDALLEVPGRMVVFAAGNSHGKNRHCQGKFSSECHEVSLELQIDQGSVGSVVVEVWLESASAEGLRVDVEIKAPHGHGQTSRMLGDGVPRALAWDTCKCTVVSQASVMNGPNGLVRIEFFPTEPDGVVPCGVWTLTLITGNEAIGKWHAWVNHMRARWVHASSDDATISITSPGTCVNAITVGACTSESAEACRFSGQGPGRRGIKKPDFVATGMQCIVANAASTDRYLSGVAGTSFAAPRVTGVIAQLYQQYGPISAEQVRAHLRQRAGCLDESIHHPHRGFGRI